MKETLENLSKTTYRPEFRQQFQKLDKDIQETVAQIIEELVEDYLTDPWHHPDVKYIPEGGEVWRLKVGSRGEKIDHRVFFDVDNDGLVFLTVEHRDQAYQ